MRILLDERPCSVEAATVGEAIDAAAAMAAGQGRLIVEVEIDGEPWGREELQGAERRGRSAAEVRLVSADTGELVGQALADADSALDAVDEAQREAARLIEAGAAVEAMARLGEAMEGWESIRQIAVLAAATVGRPIPAETGRALESGLRLIAGALGDKDPIGVSDTLQYEMPSVIEQWRKMLDGLRPDAGGGTPGETTP